MAHQIGDQEQKSRNMVSSMGYCYLVNQLQSFESNPEMEIIGFPPRNHQQQSGTMMVDTDSSSSWLNQNRIIVDDPSLRSSSRDGLLGKSGDIHNQEDLFEIKKSKYLGPAQELLIELCNLGTNQSDPPKIKTHKTNQWEEDDQNSSSSYLEKSSLCTLQLLELQKRKSKLLSMLQEVDRRYKHYSDQMRVIVSSFEMVAGAGSATAYSSSASKAMSRHFRCLRDGIVGQIKATKTAMREKNMVAPGTTRGETPRLRVVDQNLRFQQMRLMESHPWRPQRGLPERSASVLRAWLFEHFLNPYPSDVDKHILARQSGLSRSQVSNWFINARVRLWKPMVEEIYLEETKEQDNMASSDVITAVDHDNVRPQDHKKLVGINSECLSSIINNPEKNETQNIKIPQNHQNSHCSLQVAAADAFGDVELDFSSYNHIFSGGGGGGGVSLTLGLQQHGESGVSLAFSPMSHSSLLCNKDHIEDCQQVLYSLLDSDQGHNYLPYRNLMDAQLLHDLA